MDNEINSCSDDCDFLSQSYNDGVKRVVGLKNNSAFIVSKDVLKKRQQFWEDLCTTYSRPFLNDIEYNIATLQRCKPLNFVQHWVNTGNLPYKALLEEATNNETDMSFMVEESLNSLVLDSGKEKPNEYHAKLSYDESSLSSSIDTTAYILSNTNRTNKVKMMAILKGAKHNASPNRKNFGNVETVQFQKTMLDNNGNAYQAALPTTLSKPTESLTQETTNNLHENIIKVPTNPVNTDNASNCNSEHDEQLFNAEEARAFNASRKCSNAMDVGQRSMVDESSMLEDNSSKLSSRKKLYCGRDSPVDLVDTTSRNKILPINLTNNLHPALLPTHKTSRKYTLYRKRRRNRFSVFNMSMLNRSIMTISSYRKRKRRKIAGSHVSENSSRMDSSKKRGIPVADKAANNPTKNTSFTEPPSSKESLRMESKVDNSVAQVEKFVNGFSEKSNHPSRTYLNPRIYLRPLTERDIQKYRSSNKSTTSPRDLCPVVRLIQPSDSDIEKYRKPNREATRPGSLRPIIQIKQLSDSDIEKYRKPNGEATRPGSSSPITQLKQPSDSDIEKYRKPNGEATRPGSSSPITQLKQPSDSDIEKYRKLNVEATRPGSLRPIIQIKQLSDSDIEKYRKPNGEATRPGSSSPITHLKQPSEFNNPERKKSLDALDVRFRQPVVRLKKLSERDIKEYKAEIVRSEYSDTAYVSHNSEKSSNISQPGNKAACLIESSGSDKSTLLIWKCNSTASQHSRQSSSLIVGASKNSDLVRQDTSNKYTGPKNSAVYQTSETAQNGFCRNMLMASSSNSSCTVERQSPRKNLKTSVSSLKTKTSGLSEKGARSNDEAISCSDEPEIFNTNCRGNGEYASKNASTKRISHKFKLSDEDEEFVNLVRYSKKRTNSKIRSPYNSPEKNSDDSVETRNVSKCTTKSMGDQLLSESIGQSTKFEKRTAYFYRKRKSKNLLYLSTEENINSTSPVSITSSSLSRANGYKSNKSQVVLRGKRNLLTTMNIKRDKSRLHTLRFQTKVFDSDSESSYLS